MAHKHDYCPACGLCLKKTRSGKAHRLYFKVIELAYKNWPENHDFQPSGPEHLRAWLQVRVGYAGRVGNMLPANLSDAVKLADFLTMLAHEIRLHNFAFPTINNGTIEIVVPQSIAYSELDEKEFAPIRQAVFEEIEMQTGIPISDLKKNMHL